VERRLLDAELLEEEKGEKAGLPYANQEER
jgi:hypothetical protein